MPYVIVVLTVIIYLNEDIICNDTVIEQYLTISDYNKSNFCGNFIFKATWGLL